MNRIFVNAFVCMLEGGAMLCDEICKFFGTEVCA